MVSFAISCLDMTTLDSVRVYNPRGLGTAIRHFRTEAGLTQAELAARARIQRTYLSKLENGDLNEQVERIVEVLKLCGARITVSQEEW